MTTTIQIKRRNSGAGGPPAELKSGEMAYNAVDNSLYIGAGDDGNGNATEIRKVGGEVGVNPAPGGKVGVNTTADDTNRLAVKSDAVLFSHDDVTPGSGDVRFTINKKSAANTASLLFQDNWSGRAELGLSGSDDFVFKVSANGTSWRRALLLDAAAGGMAIGNWGRKAGYGNVWLELGGTAGSWCCNVQDGSGRVNFRWNASGGPAPKFLVNGDRAVEWDIDGFGGMGLTVRESGANPGAGSSVNWNTLFSVGRRGVKCGVKVVLPGYSVNNLPPADPAGSLIYVRDESGGPTLAFSDGTKWRRVQDRNVVS